MKASESRDEVRAKESRQRISSWIPLCDFRLIKRISEWISLRELLMEAVVLSDTSEADESEILKSSVFYDNRCKHSKHLKTAMKLKGYVRHAEHSLDTIGNENKKQTQPNIINSEWIACLHNYL